MTLLETLKQDINTARLARNTAVITILSTLLGEAAMIGKTKRNAESTDEEVTGVVRKFLVNLEETIRHYEFLDAEGEMAKKLRFEQEVLSKYMPVQMNEAELKAAINSIIVSNGINNLNQVGLVMADLKKGYAGKYNGAQAIQLARELLV